MELPAKLTAETYRAIKASHWVYQILSDSGLLYFRKWDDSPTSILKMQAAEAFFTLLELQDFVPESRIATVNIQGKDFRGLLQREADGISVIPFSRERRQEMLTPLLQRALIQAHMMDVVTHEMDHNPNNYRVKIREGKAVGLSLFDNNGGGTFSRKTDISYRTYKGYGPLFDPQGRLTVPYLDRELRDRFKALSLFRLLKALRPLIGVSRTFFVYYRIKALLRRCKKVPPERLLGPEDWSAQTVLDELNWGNTHSYLFNYLEDCCVPDEADAEKQFNRGRL